MIPRTNEPSVPVIASGDRRLDAIEVGPMTLSELAAMAVGVVLVCALTWAFLVCLFTIEAG